jgi:cell division septal protein FtsQ
MSRPAIQSQPGRLHTGRSLPRPNRPRAARPKPRTRVLPQGLRLRSRHCFLILIFLIAQGIFLCSSLFQVQQIQVAGLETLRSQQVLQKCGLQKGDTLWLHNPSSVAERVATFQNVEKVRVQYVLPGQVRITVLERQPIYQVASNTPSPVWYAVDSDGLVLRKIKGTSNDLPRLKLEQTIEVGQRLHPALIATCAEACKRIEQQFPSAVWYYTLDQRGNLAFRTFSRQYPVDVQLGTLQNLDHKLEVLQALMSSVAQKQLVAGIDLRYPAPVIRLLHPPKPPEKTVEQTG